MTGRNDGRAKGWTAWSPREDDRLRDMAGSLFALDIARVLSAEFRHERTTQAVYERADRLSLRLVRRKIVDGWPVVTYRQRTIGGKMGRSTKLHCRAARIVAIIDRSGCPIAPDSYSLRPFGGWAGEHSPAVFFRETRHTGGLTILFEAKGA